MSLTVNSCSHVVDALVFAMESHERDHLIQSQTTRINFSLSD